MRRPVVAVGWQLAVVVAAALTGCGGERPDPAGEHPAGPAEAPATGPTARVELAARAAAAQDLVGISHYTLTDPGPSTAPADRSHTRPVRVVRADDGSWRVDITGGVLGGTVDVTVAGHDGRSYQCAATAPAAPPRCVPVDPLPAEADPRVQHVFTDWLEVLTDRRAALAVGVAGRPPGAAAPTGTGTPPDGPGAATGDAAAGNPAAGAAATGGDAACFTVQPTAASLPAPVDPGVYCFTPTGTLTAARLELGTLTLVSTDPAAPPTVELPGPVVDGAPLPTATPSPTATPTGP